jgi:diguanylate cyclase (GGDEF)-like protein
MHFDPRIVRLFLDNLPCFERVIESEGLDDYGFTSAECDARDLFDAPDAATPTAPAPPRLPLRVHDSDAPAYFNQITNAHREGYALYEIARTFGSSLDIEDTITALVDKVGHVVPFDLCAVYLHDELKAYATAAHVAGAHAAAVRGRSVAPGEGVVGFVLANRRAAAHLDPMLDFADVTLPEGVAYRSQIALPLVREERLLGALAVYSTEARRYTDDHLRLLDTVARLASDALANAVQHAEAESNALTDTLTGLPNKRAIYARFEQEAARARRTNKPFQVVMLDLDDFKQVNDTFGHQAGDQMLREVARILQAQFREYDFLARYAGDEFVAFMQDLDAAQVEELTARIEKAVGRFSLHVRGGRHARVGISVGAAAYGRDGETLDQLILAADEAMYAAKSGHKNRPPADDHQATPTPAQDAATPDLNTENLASTAIN